ncbi:hypothetical protein F4779DRAFT_569668 [Xylariaceae sp. FL0662B]|nr:hypothetical protein F4779DRAFT_569668 [Xylariaceae sp. FL0662B]
MSKPTPTLRVVQATTIVLGTTVSGLNAGLSFFVIPRLLESPAPLLLRQWDHNASIAKRLFPPTLLLPGLLNAYLAYKLPEKSRLYTLAAVLVLSISPYTYAFLMPINRKLSDKVQILGPGDTGARDVLIEEAAGGDETAHALLDKWGLLHLYRPAVAFLGGCIGLYAALS